MEPDSCETGTVILDYSDNSTFLQVHVALAPPLNPICVTQADLGFVLDNFYYYLPAVAKMNQADNRAECQTQGADLVRFYSAEQMTAITNFLTAEGK